MQQLCTRVRQMLRLSSTQSAMPRRQPQAKRKLLPHTYPLGPSCSSCITSSRVIKSRTSTDTGYLNSSAAGSTGQGQACQGPVDGLGAKCVPVWGSVPAAAGDAEQGGELECCKGLRT